MTWPVGMPLVTITQDVHKLPDGSLPSSYAVHLQLSVPALVFDGQTTLIRRSITLTATGASSGDCAIREAVSTIGMSSKNSSAAWAAPPANMAIVTAAARGRRRWAGTRRSCRILNGLAKSFTCAGHGVQRRAATSARICTLGTGSAPPPC